MLELCECSSRVICLWAALPRRGGASLPRRFRRTQTGLVLWGDESTFSKPVLIKRVLLPVSTLGLVRSVKDQALFLKPQKSLWASPCALQVKTVGVLAMQSRSGSRGARRKPHAGSLGSPGWGEGVAANPPWCCRGLEKVTQQPAVMEAGEDLFFLLLSGTLCLCNNNESIPALVKTCREKYS